MRGRHALVAIGFILGQATAALALTYPVVDTGQVKYYNATGEITAPTAGQDFYG
jgi:hypothetical protein